MRSLSLRPSHMKSLDKIHVVHILKELFFGQKELPEVWKWQAWGPKVKSHLWSFLWGITSSYKLPCNFSVNLLLCLSPVLRLGNGEEKKAVIFMLSLFSPLPSYHPFPAPPIYWGCFHFFFKSGTLFVLICKIYFLEFSSSPVWNAQLCTVLTSMFNVNMFHSFVRFPKCSKGRRTRSWGLG